tara:strand:+ start:1660 stop:2331 length:672 start_codon:yes stop_codon:yes gene_type:complete
MANSYTTIKDLIRFLDDVNRCKQIERKEFDFFKLTNDLDNILDKYYISFKNNKELREQVAYNYNLIKDMSFTESKGDHIYVKDLSNHSKPNYSNEQYNSYALFVHSYLMRKFEEVLNKNLNKEPNKNPYPLIFISVDIYLKFVKYTSNNIIDYYIDYSYLKKRLENQNLIHSIRDNEFMRILYEEMELISKKDYEKYSIKNKLSSLNKSSSTNRENNFNNIFN